MGQHSVDIEPLFRFVSAHAVEEIDESLVEEVGAYELDVCLSKLVVVSDENVEPWIFFDGLLPGRVLYHQDEKDDSASEYVYQLPLVGQVLLDLGGHVALSAQHCLKESASVSTCDAY